MKLTGLSVLLPCHSLDDFPTYFEGRNAEALLAGWSALWHPALVAAAESVPTWHRLDEPPETVDGQLIAVPSFSVPQLPVGYSPRVAAAGVGVVEVSTLTEAVTDLLAQAELDSARVEPELAMDLMALGFCRLQMEVLSRLMRRPMKLDETFFRDETIAAAQAAVAGDAEETHRHVDRCLQTLYEVRRTFYPTDVHLVDVTLLAANTLGEGIDRELESPTPTNWSITTALCARLATDDSARFGQLHAAIDNRRVLVIGGEHDEVELPLLPLEQARASIAHGVREYERLLSRRPTVYARRRDGLWPALPQMLSRFDYQGMLHFTLDEGRFPVGGQCRERWEGFDGTTIDTLARLPRDAAKTETYLSLSQALAETMDADHVATWLVAHWPGATSVWHQMLRCIAARSPVLGSFKLLDDYFASVNPPPRPVRYSADKYRAAYLAQAVRASQQDPISRFTTARRTQSDALAAGAVQLMCMAAGGPLNNDPSTSGDGSTAAAQLAAVLPRTVGTTGSIQHLVVNPSLTARTAVVELPPSAGSTPNECLAVTVELPAMGFAWVNDETKPARRWREKSIANGYMLENEHVQVAISPSTGAIQSVQGARQRGNQLSQQVAMRLTRSPEEATWMYTDEETLYTTMQAESVTVAQSSALVGEIISRGMLVDLDGRSWGNFQQMTRLTAGSRLIEVTIELSQLEELEWNPWSSYYAVRFAWPDENASLWRGVGPARERTDVSRIETPEYLEIDSGSRIAILTGGLPYHLRAGARMLDTLLVVRGETARRFSLAIGVDLPEPAMAANQWQVPPVVVADRGAKPAAESGWFFHIDAKTVLATHWEPVADTPANGPARLAGFRARLLEVGGAAANFRLRSFRKIARARQTDFLGNTLVDLPIDSDAVRLNLSAHEWTEVEVRWA